MQCSPKEILPESNNTLISSLSKLRVGIEGTDISLPGNFALELLNLNDFSCLYLVKSIQSIRQFPCPEMPGQLLAIN